MNAWSSITNHPFLLVYHKVHPIYWPKNPSGYNHSALPGHVTRVVPLASSSPSILSAGGTSHHYLRAPTTPLPVPHPPWQRLVSLIAVVETLVAAHESGCLDRSGGGGLCWSSRVGVWGVKVACWLCWELPWSRRAASSFLSGCPSCLPCRTSRTWDGAINTNITPSYPNIANPFLS